MQNKKIRVLVVDDSAVVRSLLSKALSEDPGIEIVGTASDAVTAKNKLIALAPDVMTLDIDMPKEDGLSFLQRIMTEYPVKTLVISGMAAGHPETAARALAAGAVDIMPKPQLLHMNPDGRNTCSEVAARVKAVAARALPQKRLFSRDKAEAKNSATTGKSPKLLAIASSTGGTQALKYLLPQLPKEIPPTLIVQHMPSDFTNTFANALQKLCPFEIREARDGDRIRDGVALLAPGDYHMELVRVGASLIVKLHQAPYLHGVRPAADYLFHSVAKHAGSAALGVILTGMGRDGAEGLLAMKNAGSFNIAQDESSSTVFGMPKEAIRAGAIHSVLPLPEIAGAILKACRKSSAA